MPRAVKVFRHSPQNQNTRTWPQWRETTINFLRSNMWPTCYMFRSPGSTEGRVGVRLKINCSQMFPSSMKAEILCRKNLNYFSELVVGAPRFELGTSCAQGRRATRLRYAPTVIALFILKHFPTLLLLRSLTIASTVPKLYQILSLDHRCTRIQ